MAKARGTDAWCPTSSTGHDASPRCNWLRWRADTANVARAAAHNARPAPARPRVTATNGTTSAMNVYVRSRIPGDEGTGAAVTAARTCRTAATALTAYAATASVSIAAPRTA